MSRINIEIDEDTHRRLKVLYAETDKSISWHVRKALNGYVKCFYNDKEYCDIIKGIKERNNRGKK